MRGGQGEAEAARGVSRTAVTSFTLYGGRTEARDQVRVQTQSLLGRGRHTRQGAPVVPGAAHREALDQSEVSIVAA